MSILEEDEQIFGYHRCSFRWIKAYGLCSSKMSILEEDEQHFGYNPLGGRSINKWSGLGPFQSRFSPWQVQFQHNPDLSNPRPAQCSLDHIYFSPRVQPLKDPVNTGRANTRPAQFPIKARPTPWNPPAGAYGTYTRRKSLFLTRVGTARRRADPLRFGGLPGGSGG